jgi:hypothetical protein
MKKSVGSVLNKLSAVVNQFDADASSAKGIYLSELAQNKVFDSKSITKYHELLLFIAAHPDNKKILDTVEKELMRLTKMFKSFSEARQQDFLNEGMPFSPIVTKLSHDCLQWLNNHPHCSVEIDSFDNPLFDLNEVLKLTLPSLEKSDTSAELPNDELLDYMVPAKKKRLSFVLKELTRFDDQPFLKDHLFDGLGLYVKVSPKQKEFSRTWNRVGVNQSFFHQDIIRKFDFKELLNRPLNHDGIPSRQKKEEIILIAKNAMALTSRETDPTTFLDDNSLRYFELERGISIAIYGMVAQRQLPLESYVGYTLFKNGFPAAYGGCWVFGRRSNFGINILESFRGGESGFMMCQLLRTYRQVFGIDYFEVEPYQYGLDNPEGISSGAFWFYYRFGFRSLDKKLAVIAEKEQKKIMSQKGYRTSEKVLIQFTESNIALNLAEKIPMKTWKPMEDVKTMINKKYKGDRQYAESECLNSAGNILKSSDILNPSEFQVLKEMSMVVEAMGIRDSERLGLIKKMISAKSSDIYLYQHLLIECFNKNGQ